MCTKVSTNVHGSVYLIVSVISHQVTYYTGDIIYSWELYRAHAIVATQLRSNIYVKHVKFHLQNDK